MFKDDNRDFFQQRKNDVLKKLDKSNIGKWDKKIVALCKKLNSSKNYYTTSSCSGRVVLMQSQDKKAANLFLKVWHTIPSFLEIKKSILNIDKKKISEIKFKQEPAILAVACRDLESALALLSKASHLGFKRSGIISISQNKVVLELMSTEKLEFPVISSGELIVEDDFLKIVAKEAGKNMKRSWEKIEKLKEVV